MKGQIILGILFVGIINFIGLVGYVNSDDGVGKTGFLLLTILTAIILFLLAVASVNVVARNPIDDDKKD